MVAAVEKWSLTQIYLTHVIRAIVDVLGAVLAGKAGHAVAGVVGEVVDAFASVLAGRKLVGAKGDFDLAELAGESASAHARVLSNAVNTG